MNQLDIFSEAQEKGFKCSCCGQFVKMYHRKLNSSMAKVLILIYKSGKTDYFHVENWLKELNRGDLRADFHKLRYWGLLKKKVENREDGSARNGFYRITPAGIMFVEGKTQVSEKIIVFNNEFQGYEGKEIFIHQVSKFNYSELMANQ